MVLRLPTALDAQLTRDDGLTHFSYFVLAMLSEAPDRTLAMSELARLSNSSQSRLSHAVSRLERAGWASRRPHPDNGRTTLATLSDEGLAVVRRAAPAHAQEVIRLVMGDLDPDQVRVLGQACEKVLARLDGTGGDRAALDLSPGGSGTMAACTAASTTSTPTHTPTPAPPGSTTGLTAGTTTSRSSAGATTA